MSGLIWIQTVCKGYQQMTKVVTSGERVKALKKVCLPFVFFLTNAEQHILLISHGYFFYIKCQIWETHRFFFRFVIWSHFINLKDLVLKPLTNCCSTMIGRLSRHFVIYVNDILIINTLGKNFSLSFQHIPRDLANPYLRKQCRSRSDGFWRSHLIRIYTVCHSVCEFEWKHYMM